VSGGVNEVPLVHVVVVDHNGGELTLACLRSIVGSDWPSERLRIALVDNASQHPVTDQVAAELPAVQIIASPVNTGFAGGANLGLRERDDADFIAIVNNDATVEAAWLAPLVDTLRADAGLGAACPKILLASPMVEVEIASTTRRRGRGDQRDLGVRVSGTRIDGSDVWDRTQLVEGFWGLEPMPADESEGQWTRGIARMRVPVTREPESGALEVRLSAEDNVTTTVRSGAHATEVLVTPEPAWHPVALSDDAVDVINNVGSIIAADGSGRDRGWLEVDDGRYDEPTDVDAWCGAAVLVARAYLDDVGLFDERLFLYYEDIELSLRGARRGWRYRTAPTSVVRHVHAATSVAGSALKDFYNDRNWLTTATRYAAAGSASQAVVRYLLTTASYARRDIVAPLLRGDRANPMIVRRRLHAFGAYVARSPDALRARRADASLKSCPDPPTPERA
jgi:GT2 family glycosyltransferase